MKSCLLTCCRFFLVCGLLGAVPAFAQQDAAAPTDQQLAREIQQLVEELHSVRQEQRREAANFDLERAVLERQIERLEGEVTDVEAAVESQATKIKQLEAKIAAAKESARQAASWIAAAAEAAGPVAEAARRRVEQSPGGSRLARETSFDEARQLLSSDDLVLQAHGVQQLLRTLGEEWLPARSVTLGNEPVLLDGGQRSEHAWVVGLGLVSRLFVSEDGDTIGLWSHDTSGTWQLELPAETKAQIRHTLDMVREQEPPAVVPVPVVPFQQ